MKQQLFRFTFFLMMCLVFPLSTTAQDVDIPDLNLRAAIEAELGKASGDTITTADMANLTRLNARERGISDLTGLERATKMTKLGLGGNSISDISPVVGLTQLTRLSLWTNSISDISPVEALTNLTELNLSGNSISSITAVAGLTQLTWLHIQSNSIPDIAALAGLTNLTVLRLDSNSISDISALSGLHQLTELRLERNSITDLSPLVANTGLGSGDEVDVRDNPLSLLSLQTHIPALENREVTVEFDRTSVNIPDPSLGAAVAIALGKSWGDPITVVDMAALTRLEARNANITDLTGLEHATNLIRLNLDGEYVEAEGRNINSNSVSDLSPLAGLTNLTRLSLGGNSISDISPLAGSTNTISDIHICIICDMIPIFTFHPIPPI